MAEIQGTIFAEPFETPDGRQLITLQIKIQPTILPHFTFLFLSPFGLSNGTSQSSANHITSSQSHQSLATSLFFSYLHLNSPMAHPIPLSSSAICLSVCLAVPFLILCLILILSILLSYSFSFPNSNHNSLPSVCPSVHLSNLQPTRLFSNL